MSNFIKVGFHGISDQHPTTFTDSILISSYHYLDSTLTVSAPLNKTSKLRLHYWEASPTFVSYLKRNGISTLFTADSDKISYSLSLEDYSIGC